MIISAYQFEVTNDIHKNWENIKKGCMDAVSQNAELLVFPECALTGYPPVDMDAPEAVNFELLPSIFEEIQVLSTQHRICMIVGSILKESDTCDRYFNSALIFSPDRRHYQVYHKRALWGWDKDNFFPGQEEGVVCVKGLDVGVRICYEVRFPEYFRELYKKRTSLNIILFYDTSAENDRERYDLIMGHIRTRAVENVCYTLSVNTAKINQTAPTCLVDKSGRVVKELPRQQEGLLVYDFTEIEDDFGEKGRRAYSDLLVR